MSFASIDFIIFFIVIILGILIIQKFFSNRVKEIFLLLASYFFYGYWDWRFCFLLLFVTVSSYFTAKYKDKKCFYIIGIIIPLVVLGFFKYFNFFLDNVSIIIGHNLGTLNIILPIGISFYTFQALSYVIDVKRGTIEEEKDFVKLALYLSFFPQLVAGPIVRASDFLPQLKEDRKLNAQNFKYGIQLMAFGFFKKIVLADHISIFVDTVFRVPVAFSGYTILLAVLSYSIQIYFDFSGYSDIAIGCAKCLGYDFNKNFNLPFISKNTSEFWRRWHISLGTWIKDYVFYPLLKSNFIQSLNKKCKAIFGKKVGKKIPLYLSMFITWSLVGLWHGSAYTFIVGSGILQFLWIFLEENLEPLAKFITNKLKINRDSVIFKIYQMIRTYLLFSFAMIFFRASSFSNALQVIKGIFTFQKGIKWSFAWSFISMILLLIFTIGAVIKSKKNNEKEIEGYYPIVNLDTVWGLTIFLVVLGLIFGLAFTGEQPFVYFQF